MYIAIQTSQVHICLEETDFCCFANNPGLPQASQNVDLKCLVDFPKKPTFAFNIIIADNQTVAEEVFFYKLNNNSQDKNWIQM